MWWRLGLKDQKLVFNLMVYISALAELIIHVNGTQNTFWSRITMYFYPEWIDFFWKKIISFFIVIFRVYFLFLLFIVELI